MILDGTDQAKDNNIPFQLPLAPACTERTSPVSDAVALTPLRRPSPPVDRALLSCEPPRPS